MSSLEQCACVTPRESLFLGFFCFSLGGAVATILNKMGNKRARREVAPPSPVSSPSVVETSDNLILTIVMSAMKSAAGTVPKELWGLSRSLDLVAPRGFVIDSDVSYRCYCARPTEACRYPIVSLRTVDAFNEHIDIHPGIKSVIFGEYFDRPVEIPIGVENLKLGGCFDHPITLPPGLKELDFGWGVAARGPFNYPLLLPSTLIKLILSQEFDQPIILPENLESVMFGCRFSQQLTLPPALKLLDMRMSDNFNRPLRLPAHLEDLHLPMRFNHPIVLPDSLLEATFCTGFRSSVTFGTGLRSLSWWSKHPLHQIPASLKELMIGGDLQQRLDLPEGLETLSLYSKYRLPLVLPSSLKRIYFQSAYDLPLVLPFGCERIDPAKYASGGEDNYNSDDY